MFWKPENLEMNRGPPDRAEQAGTQLGVWKAEGTKRLRNWWHQVPLEVGGGQEDYLKQEQLFSLLCSLGWAITSSRAQQKT